MKKIISFLTVLSFLKTSAQEPTLNFHKFSEMDKKKDFLSLNKPMVKNDTMQNFFQKFHEINKKQSQGELLYSLSNGTKVYSLPQDKMICLVPDLSKFNMPNTGKRIEITGMPPGTIPPYKIIPEDNK